MSTKNTTCIAAVLATAVLCVATIHITAQPIQGITLEEGSVNLIIVGDWGRHGEHNQRDVAASMDVVAQKLDPHVIVSTGDNFYPNGVSSTTDPAWKSSFESVYTAHSLHVPWIVALGNHDYHGNVEAQLDYTNVSRRWYLPARYYDTTIVEEEDGVVTSVLLLVIDTNPYQTDYLRDTTGHYGDVRNQDTIIQNRFIDSVLRTSQADWKIVIGHHPMYSGGKRKGKTGDMIRSFAHRFANYGVHAYVAGHEHDLQHHDNGTGVQYFVSGAGSEVRPTGTISETKFARSTPGFLTVTAGKKMMTLRFVDTSSNVIYSTTVKRK